MSLNKKMPWRGTVNRRNVPHQWPGKKYGDDQNDQRQAREQERLRRHDERKKDFYGLAVIPLDDDFVELDNPSWERDELKFVLDRQGNELSEEDHSALVATMNKTRLKYLRSDGKKEKLRERKTVWLEDPKTGKVRKHRVEIPTAEVSAVRYEAFMLQPQHSAGLVLACLAGEAMIARKLAMEICRETMAEVERFTGYECVAGPFHPKLFASHLQISTVRIDAHLKLLREADLAHLGRKIQGAWTLSEVFGIKGEKLDKLTGHADAQVGIDEALTDRGERAVDFQLYCFIATRFEAKLGEPRFKALVPFVQKGRELVLKFQYKLLNYLDDPEGKIAEAASRARNDGRKEAEAKAAAQHAALVKKISEKENESTELKVKLNQSVETIVIAREQTASAEQMTDVYFKETLAVVADGLKAIHALMRRAAQGEKIGQEFSGFVAVDERTGVALVAGAWIKRVEEFRELAGASDVLILQAAAAQKQAFLTAELNEVAVKEPEPKNEYEPIELFGPDLRLNAEVAKHLPAEAAKLGILKGSLRSAKPLKETPKLLPTPVSVATAQQVIARPNLSVSTKIEPPSFPIATADKVTSTFEVLQGALDALALRHKGGTLSTEQEQFLRIDESVAGGRLLSESTEAVLSRCRTDLLFEALAEKVDQRLEIAEAGRHLFDIYNELKAARRRGDNDCLPDYKFLNPDGSLPSHVREAVNITLREVSYYAKDRLPEAVEYRVGFAREILHEINTEAPAVDSEQPGSPSRSRPEPEIRNT